ncbi:MAG: hypothetical protein DRH08_10630 [Deltaproteobacteria bacterium]|nr:MAG: hypothetical protein DRH08_10630 [Deltaproteobacteria bacterium]
MAKVMAVIGMHRSATSAVAKGLHMAGFPMANNESTLLPPAPSNKWGHWEDKHLVTLNDKILHDFECEWNKPPHWLDVEDDRYAHVPRAVDYIKNRGLGQWGIKDPRLVLLWPIWREAFRQFPDIDLIVVSPWRDPAAIADSLVARNNMDLVDAIRLTETYQSLQADIRAD